MKIGILSRNPRLYSTRRLVEAAKERGHEVEVIDYVRCYMNITSKKPSIFIGDLELNDFDAVINLPPPGVRASEKDGKSEWQSTQPQSG
ncbi:hypothetical protein N9894_04645 [Akkermansiaceae bacterium]|nr:hypothetical protein [Akkermansiaceae bacterium]